MYEITDEVIDELTEDVNALRRAIHQREEDTAKALNLLVGCIGEICETETIEKILLRYRELSKLYKNSDPLE